MQSIEKADLNTLRRMQAFLLLWAQQATKWVIKKMQAEAAEWEDDMDVDDDWGYSPGIMCPDHPNPSRFCKCLLQENIITKDTAEQFLHGNYERQWNTDRSVCITTVSSGEWTEQLERLCIPAQIKKGDEYIDDYTALLLAAVLLHDKEYFDKTWGGFERFREKSGTIITTKHLDEMVSPIFEKLGLSV